MKRILVTGAYGFLGGHAVEYFKNLGYFVASIGNQSGEAWLTRADVMIYGSINIENLIQLGNGYDAIIHCAGGSSVGKSLQDPIKDLTKTTLATEIVLEYIRLHSPGTKMIYVSSAAVYGDSYASPIKEDDINRPMSFYGIHKHLAEELCSFYSLRYNISISVIRFFSIYGPGLKKQLLWDACNKISSDNETSSFFGSGNEVRDWIEIRDALSLISNTLENNNGFDVINGGSGTEIKVSEVLSILAHLFDKPKHLLFNGETKIGDPSYLSADITKASALGWNPNIKLEEGLEQYVKWYKATK